jgi:hypothetical protein
MTERQQMPRRLVDESARSGPVDGVRTGETVPSVLPPDLVTPNEPSILGFPADENPDVAADARESVVEALIPPDDGIRAPILLKRADSSAGSLMMIAGAAGGLSLFLPWLQHDAALGLSLVGRGIDLAGIGIDRLAGSGLVLPVGVVLGGGVLFLLGLLAFRPARTHRAAGVVALFVSLAVAAGVIVRVADQEWGELRVDPGFLCAVVLAGFGLLGALKAMLTAPAVTPEPRVMVEPG